MAPKIWLPEPDSDSDSAASDSGEDEVRGKGIEKESGLVKGALKRYITTNYPTYHLHKMIKDGEIDLDPEYQREVVWSEAKQIGLIDSIMRNYYVPPILFAVQTVSGSEKRTCVDGKQRLTSINAFINGEIPWKPITGKGKGEKYYYKYDAEKHKKGHPLPEKEIKRFRNRMMNCSEFIGVPEDCERDLFQRVQMGMALSSAEKLQAISSPRVTWLTNLIKERITDPKHGMISVFSTWDRGRGKVFNNTCIMAMMIEGYPREKRSRFGVEDIKAWLKGAEPSDKLVRDVDGIFQTLIDILRDHIDLSFGAHPKKIAPIEWAFTGVVIHILENHYCIEDLARLVGNMRINLRGVYPKVGNNHVLYTFLWQWVCNLPKPLGYANSSRKRRRSPSTSDDERNAIDPRLKTAKR